MKCIPACFLLLGSTTAQNLRLSRFDGPAPAFVEPSPGTYEIRGPMSIRAVPAAIPANGPLVIEFEAFSVAAVPAFAVLPGPPFESKTHRRITAIGHSESWTPYAARINPDGNPLPDGWRELRLDLPIPPNGSLQLRNPKLRPEKPGEFSTKS